MTKPTVKDSLVLSIGLIAISLGLTWASKAGMADVDLPTRITMSLSGLFIAYFGNAIPKVLLRSERAILARRVVGWSFVLSGLATTALWLTLPIDQATRATFLCLGGSVLLSTVICLAFRKPAA